MHNIITKTNTEKLQYSQLDIYYDEQYAIEWCYMAPDSRPCFNPTLVREMHHLYCHALTEENISARGKPLRYQVLASKHPGIFNLGGDLELFKKLILKRDQKTLSEYAYACVETIYKKITLYGKGVTHITLVQGDALGGGMEAALAANVIIAERNAKLGLPEVLFNLFPGMGAYSLLARRIGPAKAQNIILSGKVFTAEELFELGVIDYLAEVGEGDQAVYEYVQRENKLANSIHAMRKVQDSVNPITLKELQDITDIWVESALNISSRDLRMMEKLFKRQDVKASHAA